MAIDLRSDFLARPTAAMVEAMVDAASRQPGFDVREDPVVSRLERLAAETIGKADALYCPTCMMANQIAIHLHCRPGESFITEESAHVMTSEAAAAASLTGAMPRLVESRAGRLDPAALEAAISAGDALRSRTAMVLMENTHVRSGGTVMDMAAMEEIAAVARRHEVPVHLDGARVFNAAVALGHPAAALAATATTVSFNLNKGLGAP
jgi:threonine aldolase